MASPPLSPSNSALSAQVGGDHYKAKGIQPVEFIHSNGLTFIEGNVIKYVWRWRDKGGVADLEKAKHYLEMLIELETTKAPVQYPDPWMANAPDCTCDTASNEPGSIHEQNCSVVKYANTLT